jgi:hypothetical protein
MIRFLLMILIFSYHSFSAAYGSRFYEQTMPLYLKSRALLNYMIYCLTIIHTNTHWVTEGCKSSQMARHYLWIFFNEAHQTMVWPILKRTNECPLAVNRVTSDQSLLDYYRKLCDHLLPSSVTHIASFDRLLSICHLITRESHVIWHHTNNWYASRSVCSLILQVEFYMRSFLIQCNQISSPRATSTDALPHNLCCLAPRIQVWITCHL